MRSVSAWALRGARATQPLCAQRVCAHGAAGTRDDVVLREISAGIDVGDVGADGALGDDGDDWGAGPEVKQRERAPRRPQRRMRKLPENTGAAPRQPNEGGSTATPAAQGRQQWGGYDTAASDDEPLLVPKHLHAYRHGQFVRDLPSAERAAAMDGRLRSVPSVSSEGLADARGRFAKLEHTLRDAAVLSAVNYIIPHAHYPMARFRRSVRFYAGPPHSERWWFPMRRLKLAPSGVFASACWVQAVHAYAMLHAAGIPCNLRTPHITRVQPHARHTACTLDRLDVQTRVDTAVVEGVEGAADRTAGYLHTNAVLGIPAADLHLLGTVDALPLVRQLADACGDSFRAAAYDAPATHYVEQAHPLHGAKRGDVVVVADAADVHGVRKKLPFTTAVYCDTLPLEVIVQQLEAFAAGEAQVLVASVAAVAKRFAELPETSRMVLAGGVEGHPLRMRLVGLCPTIVATSTAIAALQEEQRVEPLFQAGIRPSPKQLESLENGIRTGQLPIPAGGAADADAAGGVGVAGVMDLYESLLLLDASRYFLCGTAVQREIGELIRRNVTAPLPWKDLWILCNAPVDPHCPHICELLCNYARLYAAGLPCPPPPNDPATVYSAKGVREACELLLAKHALYYYLSQHFPESFPATHVREVFRSMRYLSRLINRDLAQG